MKKKILVLAGSTPHRLLVETAKSMGLYTIVTDYRTVERSPGKQLADEDWPYSILDVEKIVNRCKQEHVDAVIASCIDPAQRPYQAICTHLGLPCYGTEKQFYTLSDKKLFKTFCKEHAVDLIPDYTMEDCRRGDVEYPVLVKPADSCGSKGQAVCFSLKEVEEAVHSATLESGSGNVVIERFMTGKPDLSVTYMVCNGEPHLIRTTDRIFGTTNVGMSRQVGILRSPSAHTATFLRNANEKIVNMLKELGVKNGPVLMQGFVDGDHIRMYDPGFRMPGNLYGELFCAATGINLMQIPIKLALNQDTALFGTLLEGSYQLRGKTVVQMMQYIEGGKVTKICGMDEIQKYPGVVALDQKTLLPGDVVRTKENDGFRACEIGAVFDTIKEADDLIAFISKTLQYRNEDGEIMNVSMRFPSF